MRTLDEVIKANECCDHGELNSRCEDCPYSGIGACILERETDTLHYLKMYRSDMQMYAVNQKYWEDEVKQKIKDFEDAKDRYIKRLKKLDIGTLNEPLTWEQLKQMDGKPVWVEALLYKQWAVIAYLGEEYIRFEGANLYAPECRIYMGEDNGWQAYRKERE